MNDRILGITTIVKAVPIVRNITRRVYHLVRNKFPFLYDTLETHSFPGSLEYWKTRYLAGGNSGVGSYGKFSKFKAEILNTFVAQNCIETVIEFGCGDGNQLLLALYPKYLGVDVSSVAIEICKERFSTDHTKRFVLADSYLGETAELALSLDVIFHLVEDSVFEDYIRCLFRAASQYVIIYSSNKEINDGISAPHVRHRKFTDWIKINITDWALHNVIYNKYPYNGDYTKGSFSDFYFYRKKLDPNSQY